MAIDRDDTSTEGAPDEALFDGWRAGDRRAGEALFSRYVERLIRFFRPKVGAVHEDLVQRTFLACVRAKERLREGASFRAYLFTVARHELHRHVLRSAPRGFDPLTTSIAHVQGTASAEILRGERNAALATALAQIPVDLQIALELHYWEGCSVNELAEILGIPPGTVKTRLFRARGLLRELLATTDLAEDSDARALLLASADDAGHDAR